MQMLCWYRSLGSQAHLSVPPLDCLSPDRGKSSGSNICAQSFELPYLCARGQWNEALQLPSELRQNQPSLAQMTTSSRLGRFAAFIQIAKQEGQANALSEACTRKVLTDSVCTTQPHYVRCHSMSCSTTASRSEGNLLLIMCRLAKHSPGMSACRLAGQHFSTPCKYDNVCKSLRVQISDSNEMHCTMRLLAGRQEGMLLALQTTAMQPSSWEVKPQSLIIL